MDVKNKYKIFGAFTAPYIFLRGGETVAKNKYILDCEKRIAELRKRVIIDSAYIGAGFVIVLHIIGYSEDEIGQIMEQVNEVWTKIRESGKNPLIYCKDETGIEMLVSEHEKEIIDEYFKGE